MSRTIRGPLPASVYRRRRLAVLLGVATVVAVVVGLVRVATGGPEAPAEVALSGSGAGAASNGTSSPTAGATGDAAGTGPEEQRRKQRKKDREPKEPALPEPQGTCAEEDVVAKPRVDEAVAGRPVTVTLTLRTLLAEACTWEMSRSTFTWKVTSGDDEIWTSRECPRGVPSRELVVRRDTTVETQLTWGGRRSDAECSRLTEWAMPGWYHATVSPLAGEPRDTQFELRQATAEPAPADRPRTKRERRSGRR